MGKINPNLCKHIWRFACYFNSTGTYKPKHNITLFCEKCAKVKVMEVKPK